MSVINGVGDYRGHNDRKFEVLCEKDGVYFGRFRSTSSVAEKWVTASWTADGKGTERWMPDILGVREEPVTAIDPGEGYRLLGDDEVPQQGDMHCYRDWYNPEKPGWTECWVPEFDNGRTAKQLQSQFSHIVFRRKVEEPFPAGTKVRIKDDIKCTYHGDKAGHYGVVSATFKHGKYYLGWRVVNLEGINYDYGFHIDELEPDTRPELPEGYRYLAQQEVVQKGDEFSPEGYRYLAQQEVVQKGDEFSLGRWFAVDDSVGKSVKESQKLFGISHRPVAFRRPTAPTPVTAPEPTPPTPPEGFQIMPSDYCIQPGDMVLGEHWKGEWTPADLWNGSSRDSLNDRFRSSGWTYWIASPIPKPFKISDHGPGVYRTREGGEDEVHSGNGHLWKCCEGIPQWYDNGQRSYQHTGPRDLVEYLHPLPAPEWEATEDIRFEGQQRYIKGCQEEWRPTGVILTYEE